MAFILLQTRQQNVGGAARRVEKAAVNQARGCDESDGGDFRRADGDKATVEPSKLDTVNGSFSDKSIQKILFYNEDTKR